jgi:hypothetical protein
MYPSDFGSDNRYHLDGKTLLPSPRLSLLPHTGYLSGSRPLSIVFVFPPDGTPIFDILASY